MIFVVDVGNTETVLGLFDEERLVAHFRIATEPGRTADECGLMFRALIRDAGFDPHDLSGAAVASVVPVITPVLVETCERHLDVHAIVLSGASDLPIRLAVEEPLTVGADRIANTLAAMELYGRDTIVVDLGTATTFDCITAAGEFLGGVISPGVRTGAETLTRRTAKLPLVEIQRPDHVIGRRTESSLHSGIFFGAISAIDGIVHRIRQEWDSNDLLVVATGGLAPVLGPHCETVELIEPFLTLRGLAAAHRLLAGAPDQG